MFSIGLRIQDSKIFISCSLGAFFSPATILCNRLTLWVAEATGVMTASFSRKYRRPVSGVEGANDVFFEGFHEKYELVEETQDLT